MYEVVYLAFTFLLQDDNCYPNLNASLTVNGLKEILNTGFDSNSTMFNARYSTNQTYLTANFGKMVRKLSESDNGTCNRLLDHVGRHDVHDNGIWVNSLPSPHCASYIMSMYNGSKDKPTVYIQSIFKRTVFNTTLKAMMCFAKMQKSGFALKLWDWKKFKGNLGDKPNKECTAVIREAMNSEAFNIKRKTVEGVLGVLDKIKHCAQDSWCQ